VRPARDREARQRPARAPLPAGFGIIWTTVALDLVGWGIVLPILTLYGEDFTRSPFTLGLLVATFSVMQLVFAPVWGRVSDRYGRKPVLVVSLAGTALGSLTMGLAPSLWVLFLGRIIDGISGGSISAAHAAVTDMAEPQQRSRLLGLLGAAFGIGFVAGPAIGGLASLFGRRVPFFVAAAIAGVNALVALKRLPETRTPAEDATSTEDDRPLDSTVRRLVLLVLVATSAFTVFEATFALLGERRFDLSTTSISWVFVGIGLLLAVLQGGVVHPVVARYGELATVQGGLVINAVGFVCLAAADSWWLLAPALALLTAGHGLLTPPLTSLVAGRAPRERRGSILGVQQSASALARVLGPVLGGFLFGEFGPSSPYLAGALLAVVALGLTGVRKDVTAGYSKTSRDQGFL
jgi:DHA1 family tetracycline resistance protein-like MFS transporter